jgi:hypothetical protein
MTHLVGPVPEDARMAPLDVGEIWRLHAGGVVIADLVVTGVDQPWVRAAVHEQPAFSQVRRLFLEDLRLLEDIDNTVEAWEAVQHKIRQTTWMSYPDGSPVPEFLLHIDGSEAWWRWSNEPFDRPADAAPP